MKKILSLIIIFILCLTLYGCCLECDGTGEIECTVSECSSGKIYCKTCSGFVRLGPDCEYKGCIDGEYWIDCPKCESGYITNPLTWERFKCGYCNGNIIVKTQCEMCDGIGRLGEDCPDCYSGFDYCKNCGGDGKIDCPSCSK